MISPSKTGERSSKKTFLQGLTAVAVIYGGTYAWIAMNSGQTMQRLQDNLPSMIMLIDRAAPLPESPESYVFPPAPVATAPVESISEQPETEHVAEQIEIPSGPLAVAPIPGLYETTLEGMLPKISENGQTPFNSYKRPFAPTNGPKIALAVSGYGLSAADSDKALALPPEVSLILSPYSADPELWQRKARESGHEIWLSLPMENSNFVLNDPGPRALLSRSSMTDNNKKLLWILSRATGYAGVAGETDKAFLDMHSMLGTLVTSIFKRGIGYFELNPHGSEFLETLAVAQSAPFIGLDQSIASIDARAFTRMEENARKDGSAVAVMDLTPRNVDDVREWALTIGSRGFVLAPVSAIAAEKVGAKPEVPVPTTENQIIIHHE